MGDQPLHVQRTHVAHRRRRTGGVLGFHLVTSPVARAAEEAKRAAPGLSRLDGRAMTAPIANRMRGEPPQWDSVGERVNVESSR